MAKNQKGLLLMLLTLCVGCASASTSNTARTSKEQLLVANAVDQSLDKVNFNSFSGYNVFLQDKYVDCIDKNYLIASTRHRLFKSGAHLVDAPDKADVVVELRAGAIGTSSSTSFIGTPEIALPGMLTIPEVKFAERNRQEGTAKIGIVAYDAKTNQNLGDGGISLAQSEDSNWYVAGIGPYQTGTIRKEVQIGTTGNAAQFHNRVPHTVAFRSPASAEQPAQYALEPSGPPMLSPVSLDAGGVSVPATTH